MDSLNDKSSNEPLEKQRSDGVEQYSLNQINPWRESWIVNNCDCLSPLRLLSRGRWYPVKHPLGSSCLSLLRFQIIGEKMRSETKITVLKKKIKKKNTRRHIPLPLFCKSAWRATKKQY